MAPARIPIKARTRALSTKVAFPRPDIGSPSANPECVVLVYLGSFELRLIVG
jgi:hypothetical protein